MCGIFGIVSNQQIDPALFRQLGQRNTERGNLAFGGLLHAGDECRVYRYAMPFDADKVDLSGVSMALGHVRAPTGRQSNAIEEVHPFETADLLLAHNGLLLNHADFPDWRINPDLEVDSQVIIGGIQKNLGDGESLVDAIKHTVEALDGQQACWLWHKPMHDLYLWRVMSPIYQTVSAEKTVFSSVKADSAQTLLEEGIIYQLNTSGLTFTPVQDFSYYNPFKSG